MTRKEPSIDVPPPPPPHGTTSLFEKLDPGHTAT